MCQVPTVSSVQPLTSVLAGGRLLQIQGVNLHAAARPVLVVTRSNVERLVDCTNVTATSMVCPSPASAVAGSASLKFLFDGANVSWIGDPLVYAPKKKEKKK